jgi:hypothetical protein
LDDAGGFQLPKLLHDHFLGGVWNGSPQNPESARTFGRMEMPQNNRLPFPTDNILRGFNRATEDPFRLVGSALSFHIGKYLTK